MIDDGAFKPVSANERSNNGRVIKQAHYPSSNSKDGSPYDGIFGVKSVCAIIIKVIACIIPIVSIYIGAKLDSFFLYFILGLVTSVFVFAYGIIVDACSKYLKS